MVTQNYHFDHGILILLPSLSTGRLIKMCIENKKIIYDYVQLCDLIDNEKKEEISKRLMVEKT
jgi:hypothetical protein